MSTLHLDIKKERKNNRIFSKRRLKMDYPLYILLILPMVFLFIFNYIPMGGVAIAFMKYLPARGFFGSKWIGWKNFEVLFTMPGFWDALRNTVTISLWKIVLNILVPVSFTILLNEMSNQKIKKTVQTFIYLPHFVSWVLLAGIFAKLLSGNGLVNQMIMALGGESIIFMGDNKWFQFTLIITNLWKEFGYSTIVYLAAVSGVNQDLYEAAAIDGAGHWKQMLHVTLPSIMPTIVLMSCLAVGNVLNAGFDQVYNMYSSAVYETGDILDTLVYRIAFGTGQYGLSAAASLFKSIISGVLIVFSYRAAYKLSGYRVF